MIKDNILLGCEPSQIVTGTKLVLKHITTVAPHTYLCNNCFTCSNLPDAKRYWVQDVNDIHREYYICGNCIRQGKWIKTAHTMDT